MGDASGLTDPAAVTTPGGSRARVLNILRTARGPVGVRRVAEETGLHVNTARFHLDGLVEAGLAERGTEERLQPGRPRTFYRAVQTADPGAEPRSYRLLAEILTTVLAESVPDPEGTACAAGRVWGRYFTERPRPFEHIDADTAVDKLVGMLDSMGFAPEVEMEQGTDIPRVNLRHCPFREVAERHRVVCAVHLGLMQGAFAEMRAPLEVEDLERFVEPDLCVARLAEAAETRS